MKVIVTGATGFLGRFLCPSLREAGHEVVALGSAAADLTHGDWHTVVEGQSFDRVYHLAAWTQAGDFCLRHPGEQWVVNQQINTNVLSWWQRRQPQAKIICMGTSCSYAPLLPLSEEHYLEGTPEESLYTYAMTKRMLLVGLRALHKQYGLRYLYVVPSTLYGPDYHSDGRQMHFIFDLIRKILQGKLRGERVVLWGDGQQRRELMEVRDFVKALVALDGVCENDVVNIASGREHSIREYAAMICAMVGYDPAAIEYDTSRYVGVTSKRLANDKLKRLLPEFSLASLAEGLPETVDWIRRQLFPTPEKPVR